MKFKAKTFKLGNAKAIYLPKEVYTLLEDKEYEWQVYTNKKENKVYTKKEWCRNHWNWKSTCKCL